MECITHKKEIQNGIDLQDYSRQVGVPPNFKKVMHRADWVKHGNNVVGYIA